MDDEAIKSSFGKLKYHAFLNRRRIAVETARRAILQFREARALLTSSDCNGRQRDEIDRLIDSLARLLPPE